MAQVNNFSPQQRSTTPEVAISDYHLRRLMQNFSNLRSRKNSFVSYIALIYDISFCHGINLLHEECGNVVATNSSYFE